MIEPQRQGTGIPCGVVGEVLSVCMHVDAWPCVGRLAFGVVLIKRLASAERECVAPEPQPPTAAFDAVTTT